MPVNDFESKVLEIKDYVDEGKVAVKILKLSTENAASFDFKPGQFVMIYTDEVKSPNDPNRPKLSSMSICNAPHQKGYVELCIRMHEKPGPSVSRFIRDNVKAGGKLKVKGPFGVFGMAQNHTQAVFVSTGTGIAPMMSMLRHLIFTKFSGKIIFFYGCRNQNDFLYKEELFKAAKENKNVDLQIIFSREKYNDKQGYVQDLLKAYNFANDKNTTHVYLCGNPTAVTEEKKVLNEIGFKEENLHDEKW